jgi:hypothetical protein
VTVLFEEFLDALGFFCEFGNGDFHVLRTTSQGIMVLRNLFAFEMQISQFFFH